MPLNQTYPNVIIILSLMKIFRTNLIQNSSNSVKTKHITKITVHSKLPSIGSCFNIFSSPKKSPTQQRTIVAEKKCQISSIVRMHSKKKNKKQNVYPNKTNKNKYIFDTLTSKTNAFVM